MKVSGGFEKYQGFMADWVASAMRGREQPNKVESYTREEQRLIDDVFRRFSEISEAVDNIDLSHSFIKGRMPKRRGLKLDAYLMYHITFYLQEMYILNMRLESYAKIIMRRKKRAGDAVDEHRYERLAEQVRSSLSSIVKVRGAHVHDRLFGDETLRWLGALSFLSIHDPKEPKWAELAKDEYWLAKSHWSATFKKNRAELAKVLDSYFAFMHSELLGSNAIAVPSSSCKPKPLGG